MLSLRRKSFTVSEGTQLPKTVGILEEECNGNGNTRKEDVIKEEGGIGRAVTEHQLPERI